MFGCLLVLAVAAAPAPAPRAVFDFPTPSPADCERLFVAYDVDHNGTLTYKEYADGQWGQLRFAMAPTEAQIRMHMKRYMAQAAVADTNHNGTITRAEHQAFCQSGRSQP